MKQKWYERLLLNVARPIVRRVALRVLESQRGRIVDLVNRKVDLPKLDESEERRIIDQLYGVVTEATRSIVERI